MLVRQKTKRTAIPIVWGTKLLLSGILISFPTPSLCETNSGTPNVLKNEDISNIMTSAQKQVPRTLTAGETRLVLRHVKQAIQRPPLEHSKISFSTNNSSLHFKFRDSLSMKEKKELAKEIHKLIVDQFKSEGKKVEHPSENLKQLMNDVENPSSKKQFIFYSESTDESVIHLRVDYTLVSGKFGIFIERNNRADRRNKQ